MIAQQQKDDAGKLKVREDGSPQMVTFIAIALPKEGTTHWNQTAWGRTIYNQGVADWPRGEHARPDFAWKVEDGDSQIPNKRGKKNADREGYPGHWIIKLQTGLGIKCYHVGKYDPLAQIQDAKAIKPGDYCRVAFTVRGNAPSQSPGVYLNPSLFELSRVGQEIVLDTGMSAGEAFGGAAIPGYITGAPAAQGVPDTTPAQVAPNAAPAAQVVPAHDFLHAAPPPQQAPVVAAPPPQEVKYSLGGVAYTAAQLAASGWSDAQIQALPRA
jgi:hypothetical protein